MGVYEQMQETLFANLEGFGAAEPLLLYSGNLPPVDCPMGYCAPPAEQTQTDEMAEWEVSSGTAVVPYEFGKRLKNGDKIKRQAAHDDRMFVITGILSSSQVAVVFSIGLAEMNDLYGSGTRRMRGGGGR